MAEVTAVRIYYLMNEDYELFKCAEELQLTTHFTDVFSSRAIKPIYCSADIPTMSLNSLFGDMQQLMQTNIVAKERAVQTFLECHKAVTREEIGRKTEEKGKKGNECSTSLMNEIETIIGRFRTQMTSYVEERRCPRISRLPRVTRLKHLPNRLKAFRARLRNARVR